MAKAKGVPRQDVLIRKQFDSNGRLYRIKKTTFDTQGRKKKEQVAYDGTLIVAALAKKFIAGTYDGSDNSLEVTTITYTYVD